MKKQVKVILVTALLLIGIISFQLIASADDLPFDNLFAEGFAGYTSDEAEVLTSDFVSSKHIDVKKGETLWFGPCDPAQYFHLVGFNEEGKAVTDKIRGKELKVADTFNNDMVVYQYKVPSGVAKIVISAPSSHAAVYAVSKTAMSSLQWQAYWTEKNVNTEDYIGQSSYYEVAVGDKLYFGAITKADALQSKTFDKAGNKSGIIDKNNLRLVESFGGNFGIYCYTNKDSKAKYVEVPYDVKYDQYYTCVKKGASDKTTDDAIVNHFITEFGIQKPMTSTVNALKDKSTLFLGDSITYGARDRANIYEYGSWAGRIGYFCDMDVLNNGVSGACITTSRVESSSTRHYIYNNLVAAKDQKFNYVIMHGMFNDASDKVQIGTPQGKKNFNASKADVTKFADALELLFYTAGKQHPEATLGYIVNFHTDRAVDQTPYAEMAIKICKDWGIQYLDLYNNKSFTVEFDDGLHPSSAGYDSMYTIVANWMASLKKGGAVQDTKESTANVMSYNVYWDISNATGITDRVSKIGEVISANNPDILMLQEVSGGKTGWAEQIQNYAAANGYGYYGYAHGSNRGMDSVAGKSDLNENDELTPVLWKTDKYDCVDRGHFQASSTPDKAGSIWEGIQISGAKNYPRCVNWVVLKDKTTGEKLIVVSYHADPYTETIRNLSSQLVVEKVSKIQAKHAGAATLIGGDWNMQRKDRDVAYMTMISNGYQDLQMSADVTTPQGSYNAWNRVPEKFGFGDYLFVDNGTTAEMFEVVDDKDPGDSGKYLSDHSPIKAIIKY